MLLRLRNAAASMEAMTREQERTASNLANAGTTGYKRDRMFTEVLNERLDAEGAPRSDRLITQGADFVQGALTATGNPLDVALADEGFFVVTGADGAVRYTRAGRFITGADGQVQTPEGWTVDGADGPLQIPADGGTVQIARDGSVSVDGQAVGKLRVVRFADAGALQRDEGATFLAPGQEPEPMETPNVVQGHIEESNVDPVAEMTDMIEQFRLFESQQKVLQTTDQILSRVTRDLGRF